MKTSTHPMALVAAALIAACSTPPQASSPTVVSPERGLGDIVSIAPEEEDARSSEVKRPGTCTSDDHCPEEDAPTCHRARCEESGSCGFEVMEDFTPCDDGNPCTSDTYCIEGGCSGGRATMCSDGNPCTMDACDPVTGCSYVPAPNGGACDDNDPCSLDDTCLDGLCLGTPKAECACDTDEDCLEHEDGDLCNGSLACVEGTCHLAPETIVDCPSAGQCEFTACQPSTGTCVTQPAPNGTGCDDGNPCTLDDRCDVGSCIGSPGACPCTLDEDCAVLQDETYDLCQGPLRCDENKLCVPDSSSAVTCVEDDNPDDCIEIGCSPGTGLCATLHRQDGSACKGQEACGPLGTCFAGECVLSGAGCDDGDPCTEDLCLGEAGCAHEPLDGVACSDGDACTADDVCVSGLCEGGSAVVCDDQNPCTLDKCASADGGCTTEALSDGESCQPYDLCLSAGVCVNGLCTETSAITCPPASLCHEVTCEPDAGCTSVALADGSPCDDEDPCTQPGACEEGSCKSVPVACNDNNPCTVDSCATNGCTHTPLADGEGCDTGDVCEEGGTCLDALCQGATPVLCAPGACDVKACDPATGACVVSHLVPDGDACGALTPCDLPGSCSEGTCVGVSKLECDDADACTVDACEEEFGLCKHSALLCPPAPETPCATAGCDALEGCVLSDDPLCTDETLLWFSALDCEDASLWTLGDPLAPPHFVFSDQALKAGALGEGCHGQIHVPAEAVAQQTPWTSSMLTPTFDPSDADTGLLTVRFWHTWEWSGTDVSDDVERRVQLLGADEQVLESIPLDGAEDSWATWAQRDVSFSVEPSGEVRVAFALTSKPTEEPMGYTWAIDHVVVYRSGAPD